MMIEKHYGKPMDIEWALDEDNGKLFIVQARAETVQSRKNPNEIEEYVLTQEGSIITKGTRVGNKIGAGKARRIMSLSDIGNFKDGDVLVTEMTDQTGLKSCVERVRSLRIRVDVHVMPQSFLENWGIPCVVGTANATQKIEDGDDVTVNCAGGNEGIVYKGILKFDIKRPT